jgi:hypothetical protein
MTDNVLRQRMMFWSQSDTTELTLFGCRTKKIQHQQQILNIFMSFDPSMLLVLGIRGRLVWASNLGLGQFGSICYQTWHYITAIHWGWVTQNIAQGSVTSCLRKPLNFFSLTYNFYCLKIERFPVLRYWSTTYLMPAHTNDLNCKINTQEIRQWLPLRT